MSVRINGKIYGSPKEAAEALGVHRSTIYHAIAEGREDKVGMRKPHKKPVFVNGVHYPSIAAAARDIGVTHTAIFNAIRRGTTSRVGKPRGKPFSHNGVKFDSLSHMQKELDLYNYKIVTHWRLTQRKLDAYVEKHMKRIEKQKLNGKLIWQTVGHLPMSDDTLEALAATSEDPNASSASFRHQLLNGDTIPFGINLRFRLEE